MQLEKDIFVYAQNLRKICFDIVFNTEGEKDDNWTFIKPYNITNKCAKHYSSIGALVGREINKTRHKVTQKTQDDAAQGDQAVVAVSCSPGTEQGRRANEEGETEDKKEVRREEKDDRGRGKDKWRSRAQ